MEQALIPIHYHDPKEGILLDGYADTLVFKAVQGKKPHNKLVAIHFRGYPEHVKGMADAIYGGGAVTAELPEGSVELTSVTKQYDRTASRDGTYSQAFLRLKDDAPEVIDRDEMNPPPNSQTEMEMPPRSCWIYTPRGDRELLFREIDRRIRVPLIRNFRNICWMNCSCVEFLFPCALSRQMRNLTPGN